MDVIVKVEHRDGAMGTTEKFPSDIRLKRLDSRSRQHRNMLEMMREKKFECLKVEASRRALLIKRALIEIKFLIA